MSHEQSSFSKEENISDRILVNKKVWFQEINISKSFLIKRILYYRLLYETLYHFTEHNNISLIFVNSFKNNSLFKNIENEINVFLNSLLTFQFLLSKNTNWTENPNKNFQKETFLESLFNKIELKTEEQNLKLLSLELSMKTYLNLMENIIDLLFKSRIIISHHNNSIEKLVEFSCFINNSIIKILMNDLKFLVYNKINQ